MIRERLFLRVICTAILGADTLEVGMKWGGNTVEVDVDADDVTACSGYQVLNCDQAL